ncbi:DMT family transporter [Convivina praedatoris]|uniref:EamA domain-containing protein n=1 Tax=Convivina praedatoris TaxID=2880963 RepID=A0ABN8HBY3_9LACO|nr:DMT family transporter [Convivina sp. LMG 32447]CAH1851822.1 hypothetical protein LMG032447_00415 [Convivina sp. LMG 32447]CAH1851848.1 hypothetical protein R078138_00425 [Convivina sp. LMG 32447]CAH1853029.1 hypothetical protein R077815_00692 [Convivina sp. LMG 32447]
MMHTLSRRTSLIYAITGSILWGASGTVAQSLFNAHNISATWLVGVRLLTAGLLLLFLSIITKQNIFNVWRDKKAASRLMFFSFLGMLPSQLSYFMAIQYGNAATATVLQFLAPVFITIYLSVVNHFLPSKINLMAIGVAMIGTFLLVTSGNINSLSLTPIAIIWGLLAGLSQASYTLLPRQLLTNFSETAIVGWSMLISSIPFWYTVGRTKLPPLSLSITMAIAFIIIGGTIIFVCLTMSMQILLCLLLLLLNSLVVCFSSLLV